MIASLIIGFTIFLLAINGIGCYLLYKQDKQERQDKTGVRDDEERKER